jgi:hypothetical protein
MGALVRDSFATGFRTGLCLGLVAGALFVIILWFATERD